MMLAMSHQSFKALMSYEHIYVIGLNDHVWRLHLEEGFYYGTVLHFCINTDHVLYHFVCLQVMLDV